MKSHSFNSLMIHIRYYFNNIVQQFMHIYQRIDNDEFWMRRRKYKKCVNRMQIRLSHVSK